MRNKKGTKKATNPHIYGSSKIEHFTLGKVANTNLCINIDNARDNLLKLKSTLPNGQRLESLRGLYTDINDALGINSKYQSHYGIFNIERATCTIRVSNHNASAKNYCGQDPSNVNISIMIRSKKRKNSFSASPEIHLVEYVYYDDLIKKCPDLVIKIIDSILGYLSTGEIVDLSGVAKRNVSPLGNC
jgi:hypothetical protein